MEHKFGTPLFVQTPIWDDLTRVVPHTLQLVIVAELLALLIGILIGVYSAIRQYSVFDYSATMLSFLGFAMPVFWLALMLQILFTEVFLRTTSASSTPPASTRSTTPARSASTGPSTSRSR